jgi:hypothetical protein
VVSMDAFCTSWKLLKIGKLEIGRGLRRRGTYYRLEKSSFEFMTPQASITMMHTAVNGMFFHRLFGIRAGLPARSR